MAGELLYLDSSAIVKLVLPEPETTALLGLLRSWPERVSSVIARIEVERVARRFDGGAVRRARAVLSRIGLVEMDEEVVRRASVVEPRTLRSLDAVHLATALSLGGDLGALCVYDARLSHAAAAARISVIAPS